MHKIKKDSKKLKQELINNYDDVDINIKIDKDFPERNETVMFSI
jgi:hypothetical protein